MTAVWQKEFFSYLEWLKAHSKLGEKWAVGVSGGADSLALIILLADWVKNAEIELAALTVQHGLRPEAEDEAQYVAQLMAQYGIEHHILYWEGEKPITGVENAARQARYELIHDWCVEHEVKSLFVAHHKRDQAETFLMRLQRGSGVDGLAAMAPISKWRDLLVVRPLLQVNPEELRKYLQERNVRWVEDSSNQCEDFLRVKIRKLLPELENYIGLTRERICNTSLEMGRVRDYLEKQRDKFINSQVRFYGKVVAAVAPEMLLSLHEEMGLRVLSALLKKIGKLTYPLRMEELERLWEALQTTEFKGRTLGGCEIFILQKKLWVVTELKNKQILSTEDWKKFIFEYPQYGGKCILPYKVRCVLYNEYMR